MRKFLFLLIILVMVLPALGEDGVKITINGRDMDYILLNNEPYVQYSEIVIFGFKEEVFKTIPYEIKDGKYYYQLQGCCNLMGLISAEKNEKELKIKLNLCELACTIKSKDIKINAPVKISVYDRDGKCVREFGMYEDMIYKIFLPPGKYLFRSNRYELSMGGENKKISTTWGYENTYTKSPYIYVGQTYPYPYQNYPYQPGTYPYPYQPGTYPYQYQNYPYQPGTYPYPYQNYPYQPNTYIQFNPTETSVKSSGSGYVLQADEAKKTVYYYWEREITVPTGDKIDVEINDSSIHYF